MPYIYVFQHSLIEHKSSTAESL